MKLIKKNNTKNNFLISLMILLILLSLFLQKVESAEYKNEVVLIIEGNGPQKILGESVQKNPSQIIIKDYTKNTISYTYDLENITNTVKIKWDTPLTS